VFTDRSFANNKDITSQIEYIIILVNEDEGDDVFNIRNNIIYWSSIKYKKITRSVLASEIYGLVGGFDLVYVLADTLRMITSRIKLLIILFIIYTDSYSLYECLVKLGTTIEKRLIIDIINLK
jgi:hypothetical protein